MTARAVYKLRQYSRSGTSIDGLIYKIMETTRLLLMHASMLSGRDERRVGNY